MSTAGDPLQEKEVYPFKVLPQCLDCDPICKPKKQRSSTKNEKRFSRDISNPVSPNIPRVRRHSSGQALSQIPLDTVEESAKPPLAAASANTSVLRRASTSDAVSGSERPGSLTRESLSYCGKLPADWTLSQQERLQRAVAEVSRNLKVRPPGIRAMKAVVAARREGKREADGAYDLRQVKQPRAFKHISFIAFRNRQLSRVGDKNNFFHACTWETSRTELREENHAIKNRIEHRRHAMIWCVDASTGTQKYANGDAADEDMIPMPAISWRGKTCTSGANKRGARFLMKESAWRQVLESGVEPGAGQDSG